MILTLISFFLPFIITTIVLKDGEGLRFGLILSWIIFFGVGAWTLRLFLWNVFGREEIYIDDKTIHFHSNYKYFKDNKKIFEKSEAQLIPKPKRWLGNNYFVLVLKTPKDEVETSILINEQDKNVICDYFGLCCIKNR
ncbi:MAG: hypothetical protein JJT77_10840 [Crocinitomicaceae bacterium]|nr:hypothetical protein [Crocinitomicaceae bacterium]